MIFACACGNHLVSDSTFGFRCIGRCRCDIFRNFRSWRSDFRRNQLNICSNESARGARLRQPALALFASLHFAKNLSEFFWQFVEWHSWRSWLHAAVLQRLAFHALGSKMERNELACGGLFARTFFRDLVSNSTCSLLRICGHLRCFLDINQLNIEAKHATWTSTSFDNRSVCKVFRNPETTTLSDHHQLQPFGPTFDHLTERKTCRFTTFHRAIEHFSIRRPAGIMNGHRIGSSWFFIASSSFEDFRG